jgi:hypothetical protein
VVDSCFLFIPFLSMTTPLGLSTGTPNFTVQEIAAFFFIVWRVSTLPKEKAAPHKIVSILLWGCWLAVAWIGLIWLCAANWSDRRSPLIDWILAVSLFTLFVRVPPKNRQGLKLFAILFILAALPNLTAGIYQHFGGIGHRHKDLLGWNWKAESTPIQGFFSSPNDLAIYLYWILILTVGLARAERRWNIQRIIFSCLAVLCSLALYWTYSRLTLLAAGCALAGIFLLPIIPRKRMLGLAVAVPLAATGIILWISMFYPLRKLFSRRLILWSRTIQVIFQEPLRMALGYLSTDPLRGKLSVWWIPHNIYLLAWMEFGIPGFLGLAALAFFILGFCWTRYDALRTEPLPAALSLGMLGMMFIIGMGSLYLYEGFTLLIFFSLLGLWGNHARDLPRSSNPESPARA